MAMGCNSVPKEQDPCPTQRLEVVRLVVFVEVFVLEPNVCLEVRVLIRLVEPPFVIPRRHFSEH